MENLTDGNTSASYHVKILKMLIINNFTQA